MSHPVAAYWFAVENLLIAGAYVFMGVKVAPVFLARNGIRYLWTKVGAIGFFLLCGFTHVDLALTSVFGSAMDQAMAAQWHMHLIHAPQAVLSWVFVVGLYCELIDIDWHRPRP